MTGECKMRANARTAGRRRIVLVNRRPPRPRATPPVDVNYRQFQRAECLPSRGRSKADPTPDDASPRENPIALYANLGPARSRFGLGYYSRLSITENVYLIRRELTENVLRMLYRRICAYISLEIYRELPAPRFRKSE